MLSSNILLDYISQFATLMGWVVELLCFLRISNARKEIILRKVQITMLRQEQIIPPLAYDIKSLIKATGRGRSAIYQEIAAGRLKARKAGRRTVILHGDAVEWLDALPLLKTLDL